MGSRIVECVKSHKGCRNDPVYGAAFAMSLCSKLLETILSALFFSIPCLCLSESIGMGMHPDVSSLSVCPLMVNSISSIGPKDYVAVQARKNTERGETRDKSSINTVALNDLLVANPALCFCHDEAVQSYLDSADYQKAIGYYSDRLKEDPRSAVYYYLRARVLLSMGRLHDAVDDLGKVVALAPRLAEAYKVRANIRMKKGEVAKALRDYDNFLNLVPDSMPGYLLRAEAYADSGSFQKAIDDYSRVIDRSGFDAQAYMGRGSCLLASDKFDDAIADFTEVLRMDASASYAYSARANAYTRKGEFAKAISDIQKVVERNPDSVDAYVALAWIQATCPIGGYRDGASAVDNALNAKSLVEGYSVATEDALACAYAELGDFHKAIATIDAAMNHLVLQESRDLLLSRRRLFEQHQPYRMSVNPTKPQTGKSK